MVQITVNPDRGERARVTLDGAPLMTIPNRAGSGAHAAKLRPLTTALKAHRERWIADHPGQEAPGEIVLQANAGVAFAIIKQVMNACQGAGFPDVVFAAAPRP